MDLHRHMLVEANEITVTDYIDENYAQKLLSRVLLTQFNKARLLLDMFNYLSSSR